MSKRELCPHCDRPIKTCLCESMCLLDCDYQLVIFQDPKEAKHALSSAPLLAKSIEGAHLIVGEQFDPNEIFGERWQQECLLVFPHQSHITAAQARGAGFKYLILLDGTWRKVSRLMHLNSWLNELSCIAIELTNASEYQIRKSPREDGLSTIEAAVEVLNALQPEKNFSPILGAFRKMIQFQIDAMGKEKFSRNYQLGDRS